MFVVAPACHQTYNKKSTPYKDMWLCGEIFAGIPTAYIIAKCLDYNPACGEQPRKHTLERGLAMAAERVAGEVMRARLTGASGAPGAPASGAPAPPPHPLSVEVDEVEVRVHPSVSEEEVLV